jgi:hypothetical protein
MTFQELLHEAQKLSRPEQYEMVQALVASLAAQDRLLQDIVPDAEYEVWSPYDAGDAAIAMMEALAAFEAEQAKDDHP